MYSYGFPSPVRAIQFGYSRAIGESELTVKGAVHNAGRYPKDAIRSAADFIPLGHNSGSGFHSPRDRSHPPSIRMTSNGTGRFERSLRSSENNCSL